MKQEVRIIGGRYRGKKLAFPKVENLRPTPDRVKETVFNWLMHKVRGARCLDAFAGSGALGLEAFSRGASEVILLESSEVAYKSLSKLVESFQASEIQVVHADALKFLLTLQRPYDLIFLDPPFSGNFLEECLELIYNKKLLLQEGVIYIESPLPIELNHNCFNCLKSKKAGQVYFGIYGLKLEPA